jgi:chromosome segregation ATPase
MGRDWGYKGSHPIGPNMYETRLREHQEHIKSLEAEVEQLKAALNQVIEFVDRSMELAPPAGPLYQETKKHFDGEPDAIAELQATVIDLSTQLQQLRPTVDGALCKEEEGTQSGTASELSSESETDSESE